MSIKRWIRGWFPTHKDFSLKSQVIKAFKASFTFFFLSINLKEREKGRDMKMFYLLVHSSDGISDWGWVSFRQQPETPNGLPAWVQGPSACAMSCCFLCWFCRCCPLNVLYHSGTPDAIKCWFFCVKYLTFSHTPLLLGGSVRQY